MQHKLRNPGCDFCCYYQSGSVLEDKVIPAICVKNAKRIVIHTQNQQKRWNWINCFYPKIKNKRHYCEDFKMATFVHSLSSYIVALQYPKKQEEVPLFLDIIWWMSHQESAKKKNK